jgi:anti-anti-sigma factor
MEISEQNTDQCVIIGIEGRLDTMNYTVLEQKLMELFDHHKYNILVDCTRMNYISSSGLRILLIALKRITLMQGKFVLCGLKENIHEIFEISGFTSIFEIHQSVEEAGKVFSGIE